LVDSNLGSSCLSLLSAGITSMYHNIQLTCSFLFLFFQCWGQNTALGMLGKCSTTELHPWSFRACSSNPWVTVIKNIQVLVLALISCVTRQYAKLLMLCFHQYS
jgi:hypothetical protein